jgi:ferredoxin
MAHRLHALGRDFRLHYSVPSRARAAFLDDLAAVPWADRVSLHVSAESTRADLPAIVGAPVPGARLYTSGGAAFMDAVIAAAAAAGWPDGARHREYVSVPEDPDRVDRPFVLALVRSGREFAVPVDRSATDVLAEAGLAVDTKCSDGLCGVCATAYDAAASDAVEHRDVVLSAAERERRVILCCSRSAVDGGRLVVDL